MLKGYWLTLDGMLLRYYGNSPDSYSEAVLDTLQFEGYDIQLVFLSGDEFVLYSEEYTAIPVHRIYDEGVLWNYGYEKH